MPPSSSEPAARPATRAGTLAALGLLAVACVIHLYALTRVLHPRVSEEYAARFITRIASCLTMTPAPVVSTLPAELPVRAPDAPARCFGGMPVGWHAPEGWATWSARPRADIAFDLSPGITPSALRLQLRVAHARRLPQRLEVSVNGTTIETRRVADEAEHLVTLPGTTLRPGPNRVSIRIDRTTRPRAFRAGQDTRNLGFALMRVELLP